MKKYIGLKTVNAEPCEFGVASIRLGFMPGGASRSIKTHGYFIEYSDGYRSWVPKKVFENTYRQYNGMNFGLALEALKQGKKVYRECWPDGAFLWLKPAARVQADWCKDPLLKELAERNGGSIDAQGTICAHINGTIVSGYTPLQEELLAEDWVVTEFPT